MQAVEQLVDGGCGILFGDVAQVRITRGGGGTGVAEQVLNMAQT
jgi:hypothetical protein